MVVAIHRAVRRPGVLAKYDPLSVAHRIHLRPVDDESALRKLSLSRQRSGQYAIE